MKDNLTTEAAIIGGGLAGLSAAIWLIKQGHDVVLIEKEQFPFHKVCGEYLSMESWPYLEELGLPLGAMRLPRVTRLQLSTPSGRILHAALPLGAIGISRHLLDSSLAAIARTQGVAVWEGTRVHEVSYAGNYLIKAGSAAASKHISANTCCASYGKKSNLDVKWRRAANTSNDYVAIKYHVRSSWPADTIGLHIFNGGYCGISAIEGGLHCLCYLVQSQLLKKYAGNIQLLEHDYLCKHSVLKNIFEDALKQPGFPLTISQISFEKKSTIENGMLMLGDAAGMIAPLAGNGMSMALHSGKIAASLTSDYLRGQLTRLQMEEAYTKAWKRHFGKRFYTSQLLQKLFQQSGYLEMVAAVLKIFPMAVKPLVSLTHGRPF